MKCAALGQGHHKEVYLEDELLCRHTRDGDRSFNNGCDDVSDCSVDSHRYHLLQVQPLRQVLEVGIDRHMLVVIPNQALVPWLGKCATSCTEKACLRPKLQSCSELPAQSPGETRQEVSYATTRRGCNNAKTICCCKKLYHIIRTPRQRFAQYTPSSKAYDWQTLCSEIQEIAATPREMWRLL